MAEHQHYVPILKMKRGELDALSKVRASDRVRMTPLLEVLLGIDEDSPNAEQVALALRNKLGKAEEKWPDRAFLDFRYAEAELQNITTQNFIDAVAEKFPAAVPVLYLGMDAGYEAKQLALLGKLNNGACIRVSSEDLPDFSTQLIELIHRTELPLNHIDLILDLTSVHGQAENIVFMSTTVMLGQVPIDDFRSATLAASSFPEFIGQEVAANSVGFVQRTDWLNWNRTIQYCEERGIRKLRFGDYSINYPELPEGEVTWQSAPNLRYTLDEHWYIAKGRSPKNHPLGNRQFHEICASLIASEYYAGAGFSWGDEEIQAYGTGEPPRGNSNAEIWRKIGFSHHFAKVISQL